MRAILFATLLEAKASIRRFEARQHSPSCYESKLGWIVLTGIGSTQAATTTARFLSHHPVEIYNLGFAGALKDTLQEKLIYRIGKIEKHLSLPPECDDHSRNFAIKQFPVLELGQGAHLTTSDYPLHRRYLGINPLFELVDMEGYGIAHATYAAGLTCHMYKIVSDFAMPDGPQRIRLYAAELSELLADWLESSFT